MCTYCKFLCISSLRVDSGSACTGCAKTNGQAFVPLSLPPPPPFLSISLTDIISSRFTYECKDHFLSQLDRGPFLQSQKNA
jgi:hypothetical protein